MVEINIEGVRFAYPGGLEVYPGDGLTLALETGVTALVGENGAGKTTLTKLLNGLLRPGSGKVVVAGQEVSQRSVAQMSAIVGYAFQNPDDQLFERTVRDEVSFGPRAHLRRARPTLTLADDSPAPLPPENDAQVARAIERCGLAGSEEVHPHDLGLAERKWVAIASVLATDPRVVVLDEPTLGQDAASRRRLRGLVGELAEEGKLVLVVTHDMDFVGEACPRTVVLTHGVVRHAGPTKDAFEDDAMIKEAGLEPPHVAVLARALGLPTTVAEADFIAQL